VPNSVVIDAVGVIVTTKPVPMTVEVIDDTLTAVPPIVNPVGVGPVYVELK
jgi:hypothetical protein